MVIKAKKDLCMFGTTEKSFTKGEMYNVINGSWAYLHDGIKVVDDTEAEHNLGSWFTKFKIVKS